MEKAAVGHPEEQLRSAFPTGLIATVKLLPYGDPEVEPGQRAARAFFDWPGRLEGRQADPQTVQAFCVANAAALDRLLAELPTFIGWVEFRPDGPPGAVTPEGLSYRIVRHRKQAASPGEAPQELTPVIARFGPTDLATLDSLITAGIANSRAEALRWAVGHIRDHWQQLPPPLTTVSPCQARVNRHGAARPPGAISRHAGPDSLLRRPSACWS